MKPLYIFNPENDLALASGVANYTAPASARKIKSDLQLLPIWVADKPCCIYAEPTEMNRMFLHSVAADLRGVADVEIYTDKSSVSEIRPWGWSRTLCEETGRIGLAECGKPLAELEALRQLSHRRMSVSVFRFLNAHFPEFILPEMPEVCADIEAVEKAVARFGTAMLKVPWSSSGRGVCRAKSSDFGLYRDWAKGIIRRQGAVVCEEFLDKLQDFAIEYHADKGRVRFVGYSVFYNTAQMSYDHALVAPTAKLHDRLSRYFPGRGLNELTEAMRCCLQSLIPEFYSGYIGVDMLAYRRSDGTIGVNPCVEVNLRMTMGVVASELGNKILNPERTGKMSVICHRSEKEVRKYISSLPRPEYQDGMLNGGAQLLSPVGSDTLYTAVLQVV